MRSLIINEVDVQKEYNLILIKGGFKINPPSPRLRYITVPGRDGELDITEGLTGKVEYENAEIKIELNQFRWLTSRENVEKFVEKFHGKKVEISTSDNKGILYKCRLIVDEYEFDERINYIKAHAIVEPITSKSN